MWLRVWGKNAVWFHLGWSLSIHLFSLIHISYYIPGFFQKFDIPQNIDLTKWGGDFTRQTLFSPVPPFFVGRNCLSAYSQSGQTVAAADRGQPAQNIMLRLLGYVSLAHLHIILVIYPPIIGLGVKSPQLPPVLSEIRNDFRSKCTP